MKANPTTRMIVHYVDGHGDTYTGLAGRYTSRDAAERAITRLSSALRKRNPRVEYFHRRSTLDWHIIID